MNLTPISAYEAEDTDTQLMVEGDPLEYVTISDEDDVIVISGYSNNTGDKASYSVSPDSTIYLWSI